MTTHRIKGTEAEFRAAVERVRRGFEQNVECGERRASEILDRMKSIRYGSGPDMGDFSEYLEDCPPNAFAICALVLKVAEAHKAAAKILLSDIPRQMGSKGGRKKDRKDRYATAKAAVLIAWRARSNRKEGALPWAERAYEKRWIKVKPRTAAGWIRAAEPKKKRHLTKAAH